MGKGFLKSASCAAILVIAAVLGGCEDEHPVAGKIGPDSLVAVVEGRVIPESDSFQVTLSRGTEEIKTVAHAGFFQFRDVEYGLHILTVTGKGFGELRQSVVIDRANVLLTSMRLEKMPWPLTRSIPSDSLVMTQRFSSALVRLQFSRGMDRHSVEQALEIKPPVAIRMNWRENDGILGDELTLEFTLQELATDVVHVLTLDTTARTYLGGRLEHKIEYPIINRIPGVQENALVSIFGDVGYIEPDEPVSLRFSQPMDAATLLGRIYVKPATVFETQWDLAKNTLLLVPETRWPTDRTITVGINAGYATRSGILGGDVSDAATVRAFAATYPRSYSTTEVTDNLVMDFNLPIDFNSLRFSLTDAGPQVKATPTKTGPKQVLWAFSGPQSNGGFYLRLDTLLSVFGDTLDGGFAFRIERMAAAALRPVDSVRTASGLSPYRDTLRLTSSWTAFERLKSKRFILSPAYPFSVRWTANGFKDANLDIVFPQPIPSDTRFYLFPDSGAVPGDTLSFETQALAAAFLRPFYGEGNVKPGEPLSFGWNTLIDTAGFASHVTVEPAVDSLSVEQDSAGGVWRTVLRHTGFMKNKAYTVRIGGVTDLFGRGMKDTLELKFQTGQ